MTDNLQAVRELPEYWRGRSATGESAPADELEAALARATPPLTPTNEDSL